MPTLPLASDVEVGAQRVERPEGRGAAGLGAGAGGAIAQPRSARREARRGVLATSRSPGVEGGRGAVCGAASGVSGGVHSDRRDSARFALRERAAGDAATGRERADLGEVTRRTAEVAIAARRRDVQVRGAVGVEVDPVGRRWPGASDGRPDSAVTSTKRPVGELAKEARALTGARRRDRSGRRRRSPPTPHRGRAPAAGVGRLRSGPRSSRHRGCAGIGRGRSETTRASSRPSPSASPQWNAACVASASAAPVASGAAVVSIVAWMAGDATGEQGQEDRCIHLWFRSGSGCSASPWSHGTPRWSGRSIVRFLG